MRNRIPASVDILLLGTLQLLGDDGQPVKLGGELQRGLLALLALAAPAPVPAGSIQEALWGEDLPGAPESALHAAVSRLRKALGENLVKRRANAYMLEIPADHSDLARFRRHAARGRQFQTLGHPGNAAEAYRQALAQWQGPALADLRRFEFAEQAARRMEEERLLVVEALMESELMVGEHALVIGELAGLVDAYPLRERLSGLLMLSLYRSGRQAEALKVFARLKSQLGEELGIEPSTQLAELEERILLHDPALTEASEAPSADWQETPELVSFSPGETIVEEGMPAEGVYWIESGEVEIFKTAADGSAVELARLGQGRYFGELASLLSTRRTASVRAVSPTTVSVHTVASFRRRLGAERTKDHVTLPTDEVKKLIRAGQYLQAYDLASGQIEMGAADPELRYLAVLGLARSAATTQARRLYESFGLASVDPDSVAPRLAEDITALAARLDKDMALSRRGGEREQWGRRSAERYEKAFARHHSDYLAVNAATMWLVAGEPERAEALARSALEVQGQTKAVGSEDRYWELASEAEAALVLGDERRATDALARAGGVQGTARSSRATTLRQLRLVCGIKGIDPSLLAAIANPPVVHYCGHRIGGPGKESRFPVHEEPRVAAEVNQALERVSAGAGFGSLAAGADIIAAEALLSRGAELFVTLPFDREEFVRVSVAPAGSGWVGRFERCLASASGVVTAVNDQYLDDPVLFDFCARIAMGDALVRARQLEADAVQVAVWDRVDTGQAAGTSVDVATWKATGRPAMIIPAGGNGGAGAPIAAKRKIRALVFADFAGFSRLSDAQLLGFQDRVMSELAVTVAGFEDHLLSGRTWGDGIHLVFSDIAAAAECTLAMQATVGRIDFETAGLSGLRGMRLAAHASPVFDGWDPISGTRVFLGRGLTQTARIEPRTPEGEVYVTHPFAALAALSGDESFACHYVGTLPTDKGYGKFPLYALHRRDADDQ